MTPQEMINFINTRYKSHKGIRKTIFVDSFSSLEIKESIKYLRTLNAEINVLTDYKIFLKLTSYFYSSLYQRAQVANYTGAVE